MKNLAASNNTSGASIYDLGEIMQADSVGTLTTTLKDIESKAMQKAQEERAHQEKMAKMQSESAEKQKAMELDAEAKENEKDRRKDLLVAEIRASGYGAMQDLNQNLQSDFVDNLDKLKKTEQYQETINIQQEKVNMNKEAQVEKNKMKREEMNLQRELKEKDLQIARENRNQYDAPLKNSEKKSDKKS